LDTLSFALGEEFEYICNSGQGKEKLAVSLTTNSFLKLLSKQMLIQTGQYFHKGLNAHQQMSHVTVT
jgi:hypothetical protein